MKKCVFIFGITGQDGSYLADFLLKKKYKIFGFTRSARRRNLINLKLLKIDKKIFLKKNLNFNSIQKLLIKEKPKQIYYLAGQSSVSYSFLKPVETYDSNISILFFLLEFCRKEKLQIDIYNSVSTDCFGNNKKISNEETNFEPLSPYGRAKECGYWLVKYYRENFNSRAVNGIVSNHESPLRNDNFIFKKISNYVKFFDGKKKLKIGNINISRDWGWAPDYVQAMYKINSSKKKDDYIIATGKSYSLRKIVNFFFRIKNINYKFLSSNNKIFMRPVELKHIKCSIKKIKKNLNWVPKTNIEQIVKKIYQNELF